MPRSASEHPTELELAILKILWTDAPRPAEQVREALAATGRELSYSSVITMLNIMVKKGYVNRRKEGRAFYFSPLIEERNVGRGMLGDLVNRVFDGSASAVMLELLETSDLDGSELDRIKKLIQRKAKEQS